MPFYGHVHGKLCFGQGEMGEYEASEISGRLALDHFPLDNWSHHALSHNFESALTLYDDTIGPMTLKGNVLNLRRKQ